MQTGPRTRFSQQSRSQRLHAASRAPFDAGLGDAPKSAARLAAEAAFSDPPPRTTESDPPPRVVVRKARVLDFADTGPAPAAVAETVFEPEARHPRVFRIEGAAELPLDLPAGHELMTSQRHRRVAPDKRPGPLLQVYQAAPAPPAAALPDEAEMKASAMSARLAGLDPILETIRSAQEFRIGDASIDDEWQRISRCAEAMQREIEDQLG